MILVLQAERTRCFKVSVLIEIFNRKVNKFTVRWIYPKGTLQEIKILSIREKSIHLVRTEIFGENGKTSVNTATV